MMQKWTTTAVLAMVSGPLMVYGQQAGGSGKFCPDGAPTADWCLYSRDDNFVQFIEPGRYDCSGNDVRGEACDTDCLCCVCSDGTAPQLGSPPPPPPPPPPPLLLPEGSTPRMMCADGAFTAEYCLDDAEMDPYEAATAQCANEALRGGGCGTGCLCCGCSDGTAPQLRIPEQISTTNLDSETSGAGCELPSLEKLVALIQKVCCDQQGEDCTYAPPSTCSIECSEVMIETLQCNAIRGGPITAFSELCAEVPRDPNPQAVVVHPMGGV
jgi:hypothetical protein